MRWSIWVLALILLSSLAFAQCACETDFCNSECGTASGRACSSDTDCQVTGDFLSGLYQHQVAQNQEYNTILNIEKIIASESFQIERKYVEIVLQESFDENQCESGPGMFYTSVFDDPQGKLEEAIGVTSLTISNAQANPSAFGTSSQQILQSTQLLGASQSSFGKSSFSFACCAYNNIRDPNAASLPACQIPPGPVPGGGGQGGRGAGVCIPGMPSRNGFIFCCGLPGYCETNFPGTICQFKQSEGDSVCVPIEFAAGPPAPGGVCPAPRELCGTTCCAEGQSCIGGQCSAVEGAGTGIVDQRGGRGAGCTLDLDCLPKLVCTQGFCDSPSGAGCTCLSNDDCPPGISCKQGSCAGSCCTTTADCQAPLECVQNQCVLKCACGFDTDCAPGHECVESACIKPGACPIFESPKKPPLIAPKREVSADLIGGLSLLLLLALLLALLLLRRKKSKVPPKSKPFKRTTTPKMPEGIDDTIADAEKLLKRIKTMERGRFK